MAQRILQMPHGVKGLTRCLKDNLTRSREGARDAKRKEKWGWLAFYHCSLRVFRAFAASREMSFSLSWALLVALSPPK
ncbi:MAG: hypothetical protein ABI882_06385 [Acidobacteriota bacterium]